MARAAAAAFAKMAPGRKYVTVPRMALAFDAAPCGGSLLWDILRMDADPFGYGHAACDHYSLWRYAAGRCARKNRGRGVRCTGDINTASERGLHRCGKMENTMQLADCFSILMIYN